MAENKVELNGIDGVKTQTFVKKIMDNGEVVETRLMTKVTFEAEVDPAEIAQIHRLLQSGHNINIDVYSPQLAMKMVD